MGHARRQTRHGERGHAAPHHSDGDRHVRAPRRHGLSRRGFEREGGARGKMGLRAQAAADAKAILEDSVSGFAWPLTLTSPAGTVSMLAGLATDVAESVDPETGTTVAGRRASVTISLLSIPVLPTAEPESGARPWTVTFTDVELVAATWKVVEVRPDRALGVVLLVLEAYDASTD